MPKMTGAYNDNDATDEMAEDTTNSSVEPAPDAHDSDTVNATPGAIENGSAMVNASDASAAGSGSGAISTSGSSTDPSLNAHVKHVRGAGAVSRADSRDSIHRRGTVRSGGGVRGVRQGVIWTIFAIVVVVAMIFVITFAKQQAPKVKPAGKPADTVTIGLKLAPTNLDIRNQSGSSLDQALIGNVYEGLVARSVDNKVVPAIAKSWVRTPDGKSYIFHLNDGMSFSNGDKLDAFDVVWSIDELMRNGYQGADTLLNFKSITAVDERTVRLDLTAPYADLLWVLAGRPGLVLDKDGKVDMKTQALGSGPYTVAKYVPNSSLTLKANDRYWAATKPATQTIVLRYFSDDNAAVNALKSGAIQVLAPIDQRLVSPFKKDTDHYVVASGDDTDKYVLAMNCAGEKTSDRRVRQAIRYAINHRELIASRGGADKPLGGPIPSLDPGYEDLNDVYPYNPDKARELMRQAGYTPAHPLELRLTYANIYGTELGDQLRSQLKAVGIDLKVNVVEFSTWLQDVLKNHDYDLSLVDHNESHDFASWANPKYYYNYDNRDVQLLYGQAMVSLNDKDRDDYLRRAARRVSEDAPADWLFNYRITTAMEKGVVGFPLNLNQTLLPLSLVKYTPLV